jgi:hypothetical protein
MSTLETVDERGILLAQGLIAAAYRELFRVAETGAEAARHILDFHVGAPERSHP